eukprot:m.63391 g.63391  ORF g.63391 m.63391 type:complete len:74 (-) comp8067_c0_seq1:282-503(-)
MQLIFCALKPSLFYWEMFLYINCTQPTFRSYLYYSFSPLPHTHTLSPHPSPAPSSCTRVFVVVNRSHCLYFIF